MIAAVTTPQTSTVWLSAVSVIATVAAFTVEAKVVPPDCVTVTTGSTLWDVTQAFVPDDVKGTHLDNPEVAKAKSLDDAFKVLKKQEDRRRNIELGVAIGKNFTADEMAKNISDHVKRWQAEHPQWGA